MWSCLRVKGATLKVSTQRFPSGIWIIEYSARKLEGMIGSYKILGRVDHLWFVVLTTSRLICIKESIGLILFLISRRHYFDLIMLKKLLKELWRLVNI
jgi:hypothetical protein